MPRDANGTYTLPTGNPVVPGTPIQAGWANPTFDDIALALTGSFTRDGTGALYGPLGFTASAGAPADAFLYRDAANALAQRNGASPQTLRVYNTYTDGSNYERASLAWTSNNLFLQNEAAGTGNTGRHMFISAGGNITFSAGGSNRWAVTSTGNLNASADNSYDIGAVGSRPRSVTALTDITCYSTTFSKARLAPTGVLVANDCTIAFCNSGSINVPDVFLARDAINALAQRNATSAQVFRVYGTYTDASNYERTMVGYSGTTFFLRTEQAGTGTARSMQITSAATLSIGSGGVNYWSYNSVTGNYSPLTDNTVDIGTAVLRPKNIFTYALNASSTVLCGGTGVGYTTGSGGVVTQATSKNTAVQLDKACGQITMNAAALAADTTVSFTLTNSTIGANDNMVLNHRAGGTPGAYLLNARCLNGSASIDVRNITAASLAEAIVISFSLLKGATS